MVEILNTLEDIVKQKDHLSLKEGVENKPSPRALPALGEEPAIYGSIYKEVSVQTLLKDSGIGGSMISVISIVGMGGIGKPTLAQLVYNNPSVRENFGLHAFITASDDFDVYGLIKRIIEALTYQ